MGVAAVLFDGHAGLREFTRWVVDPAVVEEWKRADNSQKVIHQAELLPTLAAVHIWKEELRGRRWIAFIDNDGARAALIGGTSRSRVSAGMVGAFWREAAAASSFPWLERVPSPSNVADPPSRGDEGWLRRNGFRRRRWEEPPWAFRSGGEGRNK